MSGEIGVSSFYWGETRWETREKLVSVHFIGEKHGGKHGGVRPSSEFFHAKSRPRIGHSVRDGNAAISAELTGTFERLGRSAESRW